MQQQNIVKWFRFYHSFATCLKVQSLTEVMQRRYVMLLCQAALNDGSVDFDKTTKFLQITAKQWQVTRQALIELKLLDKAGKINGWHKMQLKSDYSYFRVKKHRLKTKLKVKAPTKDKASTKDKAPNFLEKKALSNFKVDKFNNDITAQSLKAFKYWAKRQLNFAHYFTKGKLKQNQFLRLNKIKARLKEGYRLADIKKAVDACINSPFHQQHAYLDIELICRSPVKLDYFLNLALTQKLKAKNADKAFSSKLSPLSPNFEAALLPKNLTQKVGLGACINHKNLKKTKDSLPTLKKASFAFQTDKRLLTSFNLPITEKSQALKKSFKTLHKVEGLTDLNLVLERLKLKLTFKHPKLYTKHEI